MANAMEFSCGCNCPYSTKLLHRAGSYNSPLGSAATQVLGQLIAQGERMVHAVPDGGAAIA